MPDGNLTGATLSGIGVQHRASRRITAHIAWMSRHKNAANLPVPPKAEWRRFGRVRRRPGAYGRRSTERRNLRGGRPDRQCK